MSDLELWTGAELAEFFKCSPRHAVERIAAHPSFPSRVKLASDGIRPQPRYWAHEVKRWAYGREIAA